MYYLFAVTIDGVTGLRGYHKGSDGSVELKLCSNKSHKGLYSPDKDYMLSKLLIGASVTSSSLFETVIHNVIQRDGELSEEQGRVSLGNELKLIGKHPTLQGLLECYTGENEQARTLTVGELAGDLTGNDAGKPVYAFLSGRLYKIGYVNNNVTDRIDLNLIPVEKE